VFADCFASGKRRAFCALLSFGQEAHVCNLRLSAFVLPFAGQWVFLPSSFAAWLYSRGVVARAATADEYNARDRCEQQPQAWSLLSVNH
jgi:hypothetical protein